MSCFLTVEKESKWAGKLNGPSNSHWEDWSDSSGAEAAAWSLTLKCHRLRWITCRTLRAHCGSTDNTSLVHFHYWHQDCKYFHMRWALTIVCVCVCVSALGHGDTAWNNRVACLPLSYFSSSALPPSKFHWCVHSMAVGLGPVVSPPSCNNRKQSITFPFFPLTFHC